MHKWIFFPMDCCINFKHFDRGRSKIKERKADIITAIMYITFWIFLGVFLWRKASHASMLTWKHLNPITYEKRVAEIEQCSNAYPCFLPLAKQFTLQCSYISRTQNRFKDSPISKQTPMSKLKMNAGGNRDSM